MNSKIALAAIAAVVIVIVVAVAVSQNGNGDSDEDEREEYTFSDSKGETHTVKVPIENVTLTHKYLPVFFKILGTSDAVGGLDNTYGSQFKEYFPNSFDVGNYSTPDGATMLSHGSKIILSPTTMGISNEDALEGMGIEVIYLDMTDPYSIPENLETLVHLLGNTQEVQEKAQKYTELADRCQTLVENKDMSATKDADFATFMASARFFHTHTSAAVKVAEGVSGKSFTRTTDPNVTSSVYFNLAPSTLIDFDGEHGLDYVFTYGLDTLEDDYSTFINYYSEGMFKDLSCVKDHHVYAISTNMVNGALSCVSKLLYATAFGADLEGEAKEIVKEFNTEFGLDYDTSELIREMAREDGHRG